MLTHWWHRVQWTLFPIGLLLALLALSGLASDLSASMLALPPGKLVAVLAVHVFYVLCYAGLWHIQTVVQGIQIPWRPALAVYLASIAGKYLPLRVVAVTHRAAVYVHVWKRPFGRLVNAAAYESLLAILAGLLLAGTALLTVPLLSGNVGAWQAALFMIFLLFIVALLHPLVQREFIAPVVARIGLDPGSPVPLKQSAFLLVAYLLAWLVLGSGLYLLADAIGLAGNVDWVFCVQVYAVAGTLGMLVFVVPSGIGVREGAMTALLMTRMPAESALFLTLFARLMVTLAEILCAALGGLASMKERAKNS